MLETCRDLERRGHALTVLPVDREGRVSPADLRAALRDDTVLVSVMLANNETGTLQPVAELAALTHARGALFHTDAVQAVGKVPVDVAALGVDLASLSAHKLNGPKGVGGLYVRRGVALEPQVRGGGQEHGLRAGTENVPGIVGLGAACELAHRRLEARSAARVAALRHRLEAGVLALVAGARRNGPAVDRLPNTTSLTLPGLRGESLVLLLDRRGVCFSSGSACRSGSPEPSSALLAMGLTPEEAHATVRFSLCADATEADVDDALAALAAALRDTSHALRFVGCR